MVRIAISGASGLIGKALCEHLRGRGDLPVRLVRRPGEPGTDEIPWDPGLGSLRVADLEDMDAVVHLAGESIAAHRWTAARRHALRASRLQGTRLLCQALRQLRCKPPVLVSASAVGFYGDRGEEQLDEDAGPGQGFLATLVQDWEGTTRAAAEAGIRVVLARFGVVLSPRGGALARMLPLFRWGLGGRLGSGRQYMSWIALDDVVRALVHMVVRDGLQGPVNAVAPAPVTNAEFTAALSRTLHRPAILPAPGWALRLLLGQMADEALLASARVLPRRLQDSGFAFAYAELEPALQHLTAEAP